MPFPNFEGKHAHDPFISPQDFVDYARREGRLPDFDPPQGAIVCYQPSLMRHVLETEAVESLEILPGGLHLLRRTGGRIAVSGGFGIGAPTAGAVVEEMIALGITRFANIGTAGGLQRDQRIGDVVVCSGAIRDEGVSHHYLPPAKYAEPSAALTEGLRRALADHDLPFAEGTSWTIDTPYRETVAEVRHYQAEGVRTVEMEAAAVFAVARYRGVEAAAAFVISDSLADLVWEPRFSSPEVGESLERLYRVAVDALMEG